MKKETQQLEPTIEINKIYCESNLETMSKMPDNFVDVIITSPPYNIGKNRLNGANDSKSYDKYEDNLSKEDYFNQTKIWIDEMIRVTKHHVFYNIQEITGNKGIVKYILNNYSEYLKETFIWAKSNPQASIVKTMAGSGFEYIFCFSKDNPKKRAFSHCNFNNRVSGQQVYNTIIKPSNSNTETKGHSFAFDDWLPNYFINYFSKEGDLIYDPFMGTGTTAKSAIVYKRNFMGSEISSEYVKIANKRIEPYINQLKLF
jgi:site-specific DNA-methyltransferase (adenine-specific)